MQVLDKVLAIYIAPDEIKKQYVYVKAETLLDEITLK